MASERGRCDALSTVMVRCLYSGRLQACRCLHPAACSATSHNFYSVHSRTRCVTSGRLSTTSLVSGMTSRWLGCMHVSSRGGCYSCPQTSSRQSSPPPHRRRYSFHPIVVDLSQHMCSVPFVFISISASSVRLRVQGPALVITPHAVGRN